MFVLLFYLIYIFFQLKWSEPDEEGLIKFMVEEKQFKWVTFTVYFLVVLYFCV